MKKEFPDHIKQMLLVTPPPRHACPHCAHIFHCAEKNEDGSLSATWDEGVALWQNGERICELFLVLCPKCKSVALPFVTSSARNVKDAVEASRKLQPRQEAPVSSAVVTPPKQVEVKIPPPAPPQAAKPATPPSSPPTKAPASARELLSGKYRNGNGR